jgi:hypothetical protein
MTPVRAWVRRAIEEGNAWLIVVLTIIVSVSIAAQTYVFHQDTRDRIDAMNALNIALERNSRQAVSNYHLIEENRETMLEIHQAIVELSERQR